MSKIKLEDIEKKGIHQIPDNYFEELPLVIQYKTSIVPDQKRHSFFSFYRVATISGLICIFLVFFFLRTDKKNNPSAGIILEKSPTVSSNSSMALEGSNTSPLLPNRAVETSSREVEYIIAEVEREEIFSYLENHELENVPTDELIYY